MTKFLLYLVIALIVLGGLLRYSLEYESAQETALRQVAGIAMQSTAKGVPTPDGLQAFICGSASPLPAEGRAQACVAVLTPSHFYIVDAGAGSTNNLSLARMPFARLQGIFVTHYHSDHIGEIAEMNLNSWVAGRPEQLTVYGPKGIRKIVNATNELYELDRRYRVEHHGEELLEPKLGVMKSRQVRSGVVLEDGDLTVTAYRAAHSPVSPALGYRFDYRGRSIVISGDSLVTDETRKITKDADLLIHDALSEPIITTLVAAAEEHGLDRNAKILNDILDYHASTDDLLSLQDQVDMVAYYHLVPAPQNIVMEQVFTRGMPEHYLLADDGMWFQLPAGSRDIHVLSP